MIIHNSAPNPVYVNETAVASEDFYFGASFIVLVCRQHILEAHPAYADIQDLPRIDKLIRRYKSSERNVFDLVPLEYSLFLKHFFPALSWGSKSFSLVIVLRFRLFLLIHKREGCQFHTFTFRLDFRGVKGEFG